MALIESTRLTKVYRTNVKQPGLRGTVRNLFHAEYQAKTACDAISFEMEEGQSLACIGENGAGKSTLIKMMVGILRPTSGQVRVYGQDPMKHHTEYLRKIGVVFGQKTNLWWDIPVIESFNAVQVLYKLDRAAFKKTLDAVVDCLDLAPILNAPARKLSLGQRMRSDIGMVFLHQPRILFLDEPTIGLDINVKYAIREFLHRMNREQGVSIFLTSHDLGDIDQICEDALVLSKGKVFYHGGLDALKHQFAQRKVVTITGRPTGDISRLLPLSEVHQEGRKAVIRYDAQAYASEAMLQAVSKCYEIDDISIEEPGIDYVVSEIFKRGAAV